jgi:ElaB/YqjD/DUF883 family membrane-anchored ribosome-binding protein
MERTYTEDTNTKLDESEKTAAKAKNTVVETASKARDIVTEAGRGLQNKIDESRAPAAEKLESAAATLHEKAERLPGGEKVAGLAHTTAEKMQATADYVRQNDVRDMLGDIRVCVRKYPGQAIVAAAIAGFLIGCSFRSRD